MGKSGERLDVAALLEGGGGSLRARVRSFRRVDRDGRKLDWTEQSSINENLAYQL